MESVGIKGQKLTQLSASDTGPSTLYPYVPEIGIIAFVPEAWGGAWMSRHQILTRMSKYFNVIWFNPVHKGWRELWFMKQPPISPNMCNDVRPSFMVYDQSKLYPIVYKPRFVGRFTARRRLQQARRMLLNRGCNKIVQYLWRPDFAENLELLPYHMSCYHIVDEYTFSPVEKPTDNAETDLISRVDQVFIHSHALMEKKGSLNPSTMLVPNGVDFSAFSTPATEPDDLKPIPHPRIGYIGYIKRQLDFELLTQLARRHKEWSFVFVGPKRKLWEYADQAEELFRMPNVHYLGGKPVETLPGYTQHLDVCIMSYKMNDYTKFIYPLKLHEYLATGKPVVGSPIRSLMDFSEMIKLAATEEEWSEALQASLSPEANTEEQVQARKAIARDYDWDRFVRQIAGTICERISPDLLKRLPDWKP